MNSTPTQSSSWFEYIVHVQPRHTDYAGVVWHGSYLEWMEAARIAAFRKVGLEYAELVQLGCDLPIIEMSLRYRKALKMGEVATIQSRVIKFEKVRLYWEQQVVSTQRDKPCMESEIILIPVQSQTGRILRKIPQILQDAIDQILG
jgi:acyl-CoA thioester hydrolase